MKSESPIKKDPDSILEELIHSTHTPQGKYGAESGYRLLEERIRPDRERLSLFITFLRVAAVVAILMAGWWMVKSQSEPEMILYQTTAHTQVIKLPDGSQVTLNRYSALTVPKQFTGQSREIELTGEALFEVARNKEKPFRVLTGNITTEVLGTTFNVQAYEKNKEIITTLLEGSVAVTEPESGQELILSPGQSAVYSLEGKQLEQRIEKDARQLIAWKEGEIIFRNEPLGAIIRTLSIHFNTPIELSDNILSDYRLTADFTDNEDLETILNLLIQIVPFTYEQADGTIILTLKIN